MCGFLAAGSSEFAPKAFADALAKLNDRGPDMTRTISMDDKVFGFNRLAIMDLSERGMQPFVSDDCILVCNGEIYNYYALEKNLAPEYEFVSNSDCEVLIPLYKKYGLDTMCKMLDAEFAFVLYDQTTKRVVAARDPVGIRPMFYGYTKGEHKMSFASTAKL